MKPKKMISKTLTVFLLSAVTLAISSVTVCAKGHGEGGDRGGTSPDIRFDTSFAIEYSDSCLSGCHEDDPQLVVEHAGSFMTHVMIKCNACHGTHTADTVGEEKPNLTGYYPGIGATGYQVGDDRCIACHMPTLDNADHPNKTWDCTSCHTPHGFSTGRFGKR